MIAPKGVRLPTLAVASLEALLGRTGIVYREGAELGIVWWVGHARRTIVLRSTN